MKPLRREREAADVPKVTEEKAQEDGDVSTNAPKPWNPTSPEKCSYSSRIPIFEYKYYEWIWRLFFDFISIDVDTIGRELSKIIVETNDGAPIKDTLVLFRLFK